MIGGTSYNELLSRLISLLGDDAPAAAAATAPQPAAASLALPPRAPAPAVPAQPADAGAAAAAASQPSQVTGCGSDINVCDVLTACQVLADRLWHW